MRIKTNKVVRRKPRDKGESECFFILMKAKIDDNIKKGKVKWISNREMERTIKIPEEYQRNNMKIEIDIKDVVQKIDVNKLIEEKIISDVSQVIDIENIVDETLDDEEVKNHLKKKVINIINSYLDSEEGKTRIIDAFNDVVTSSDILIDDKIIELVAEFLKQKLNI